MSHQVRRYPSTLPTQEGHPAAFSAGEVPSVPAKLRPTPGEPREETRAIYPRKREAPGPRRKGQP